MVGYRDSSPEMLITQLSVESLDRFHQEIGVHAGKFVVLQAEVWVAPLLDLSQLSGTISHTQIMNVATKELGLEPADSVPDDAGLFQITENDHVIERVRIHGVSSDYSDKMPFGRMDEQRDATELLFRNKLPENVSIKADPEFKI